MATIGMVASVGSVARAKLLMVATSGRSPTFSLSVPSRYLTWFPGSFKIVIIEKTLHSFFPFPISQIEEERTELSLNI